MFILSDSCLDGSYLHGSWESPPPFVIRESMIDKQSSSSDAPVEIYEKHLS